MGLQYLDVTGHAQCLILVSISLLHSARPNVYSCFPIRAGVSTPQLLHVIVLVFASAAILGSKYCTMSVGLAPPLVAGGASGSASESGTERLAKSVGTTLTAIVKMVVDDAVGPISGGIMHLPSAPRQVAAAVPLLLLVMKQLSVSPHQFQALGMSKACGSAHPL